MCAPIGFDDIETEIFDGKNASKGPTIKNLVIRSCACTEVQFCS